MKVQERTGAGSRNPAPAQPAVGERLPTPPRERKPALAALAVLLILIGALGATVLVLRAGDRVEVVKTTKDIQAGQAAGADNTTSVMVADDESINYVPIGSLKALSDLQAKATIPKGTVVVGQMFAARAGLPAGKTRVGLSLKEGQYPSGLHNGDRVAAYRVGDTKGSASNTTSGNTGSSGSQAGGGGTQIVDDAQVSKAPDAKGDTDISSGNVSVTVTVDSADAAALTQASSAGEVALVLVPSGN
ncbi:hypothetical protein [Streptomyces tsukubensis]|uniref:SAF domain-containing protein n=1 Tax=Streptomyces tsukubensis TaxID=83656 RepID=A0A1V4A886_9ACTN|nr:hypothetical protein [Streptomyces tsukubensis]OON78395.1 hypothetical protein B1H18_16545 [Streptomyces tsukubensis]QFR95158.1 hypothetical protein GBW32_21705 [Streptomyces tsukubensis]